MVYLNGVIVRPQDGLGCGASAVNGDVASPIEFRCIIPGSLGLLRGNARIRYSHSQCLKGKGVSCAAIKSKRVWNGLRTAA